MPDIRVVGSFESDVVRVGRQYTRAVRKLLKENRRELMDIVASLGISSPLLIPRLAAEIESLSAQVRRVGAGVKPEIIAAAQEQTEKQISQFARVDLPVPEIAAVELVADYRTVINIFDGSPGWLATYYAGMISEINRLRTSGTDGTDITARLFAEQIKDRASVYRKIINAAGVESDLMVWGASVGVLGNYLSAVQQVAPFPVQKQAIATIDERTTDCCLRVHGQIVDLDDDFVLTGTPRFADRLPRPPFHFYCRTSVVLYNPMFEEIGITTDKMRDAARSEIDARVQTGKRKEIHPSHSISKRRG